uniref:CFAP97 domain containing 2 n=1 Tax=Erpetoichthys calabaricus TaxID=27687 RepID=A0A8C4SKW8_ERPCA
MYLVKSFKFFGVHLAVGLTFLINTTFIAKKVQQHLHICVTYVYHWLTTTIATHSGHVTCLLSEVHINNNICTAHGILINSHLNLKFFIPLNLYFYFLFSLNKEKRQRELLQITKENQQILERISQCWPQYSTEKWQEDWEKNEKYMDSINL